MTFTKAMPLSYWTKEELLFRVEQWCKDNGFTVPRGLKDIKRDKLREMFLKESGLTGVARGRELYYVGTQKAYMLDISKLKAKFNQGQTTHRPDSSQGAVYIRRTPKRINEGKRRTSEVQKATPEKRVSKKNFGNDKKREPRPYSADIAAKLLKKYGNKVKRLK